MQGTFALISKIGTLRDHQIYDLKTKDCKILERFPAEMAGTYYMSW
jgi:hypothetical protein